MEGLSRIGEPFSSELLWPNFFGPLLLKDPSTRLFWLFLLSSALFILFYLLREQQLNPQSIQRVFFNRRYWLHRSSIHDLGYLIVNSLIKGFVLAPLLVSHLAAALLVAKFLQVHIADSPSFSPGPVITMVLFSLCYFLCDDMSRFMLHFCLHKHPVLWRLHQHHHRAEVLTPLTVYRLHPLEMVLYTLRQLITTALVAGLFIWLFRGQITGLTIIGVDAAGFLFNFFAANLRHSHIPISFGRLEVLFISPLQHQIHHSREQQHYDKNFGSCLAIWDKLFGTWHAAQQKRLLFGIKTT